MKYRFSVFVLNTESKEVTAEDRVLKLSRQGYEMLLLLLENPGRVFSKKELIEEVWKGRYVTTNSVDQCISKLRKTLQDVQPGNHIKTVYGKGFKLIPEVEKTRGSGTAIEQVPDKPHPRYRPFRLIATLFLLVAAMIAGLVWKTDTEAVSMSLPRLILMNDGETQDTWSLSPYLAHLFTYANIAQTETPDIPLPSQESKQYLERQWRLSPELKVATSRLEAVDEGYRVTMKISSPSQPDLTHHFNGDNISTIMKDVSRWLAVQVRGTDPMIGIQSLLPDNSFLLELYMRGLSAAKQGEIDKAVHFFSLCLKDQPDFALARLALAEVKSKQGKPEEALALLDMLADLTVWPQLEVEIQSIRADILDTQGKHLDAKKLYLQIISKYEEDPGVALDNLRYDLSHTYTALEEYDNALNELEKLKKSLLSSSNPELLADVYQKTGSIQQNLGQLQEADSNANEALALFSRLEDLPGKAKVLSLLARIANHRSQYGKATHYLQQSLQINRSLNYKLGTGATLNELIYVLMVQGHFSQATVLNTQMQDIALEIDYGAMLLASKQLAVDIARAQNQWITAQMALDEHLMLAKSLNNNRALLKNRLLSLDLYLDQKKTGPIPETIDKIQRHIEKTKENRLRPRLQRQLARYYLLTGKTTEALVLLQTSKNLATTTDDIETLTEVGILLAEYYLGKQQPAQALSALREIEPYQPLPYPYLLLKSKALALNGQIIPALEYASLCKQKANEWWSPDDEKYIANLRPPVTSSL